MKLEGSCHCGAVTFTVNSRTPYPISHCYCSKCRKTGGGGYTINLPAEADTLQVTGMEHVGVYRSGNNHRGDYETDGLGWSRLHFCKNCASVLWNFSPKYPQWVYPRSTAIDTPLPKAPERNHYMLAFKPDWVPVPDGPHDLHFEHYPPEGIEEWHEKRGLLDEN